MSSAEPPAGRGLVALHLYFCRHCSIALVMDPAGGPLLCPVCQRGLTEESDRPSSSSATSSRPLNPEAMPLIPYPPPAPATISRRASFVQQSPDDVLIRVISESDFFIPPYANAVPFRTPLPAAGSVITIQFLLVYIFFCLNEGARLDSNLRQSQITHLMQNNFSIHTPAFLSQSAIESLPNVKISEDLLASDDTQCPICLEDFKIGDETKQLPCKHLYHKDCIVPWLEHNNTCPVCRSIIITSSLVSSVTGQEIADSGEQNTEEEGPDSMVMRFEMELQWPAESRFSRFEHPSLEDGQGGGGGGGGGGEGNREDSGGIEASGPEEPASSPDSID